MKNERKLLRILAIIVIAFLVLMTVVAVAKKIEKAETEKTSKYKKYMIDTIRILNEYSKKQNENFNIIANGGYNIYNPEKTDTTFCTNFLKDVDGVLIEDIWYGWDVEKNKSTPKSERKQMKSAFKFAKKNEVPRFNIEYCDGKKAKKAKENSKKLGTVVYTTSSTDLNKIPTNKGNKKDIKTLKDVKNFMIVLDPEKYKTKKEYLKALKDTNYDMIMLDAYYNDKILTKKEVDSLRKKKNGHKRLVCTYISIGEAEQYRYYFKKKWKKNPPDWMAKENPKWKGNYKVKYWDPEWRDILKGYLDKIIGAGFDGAYFDVIDAFEYFMEK